MSAVDDILRETEEIVKGGIGEQISKDLPRQREPSTHPVKNFLSSYFSSIPESAGEAWKRTKSEVSEGFGQIPSGIEGMVGVLNEPDATSLLDFLRRTGRFGWQAVQPALGVGRMVAAPVTGAFKYGTDFPLRVQEKMTGSTRSPAASMLENIAGIAGEVALGLKAPSVIQRLRDAPKIAAARAAERGVAGVMGELTKKKPLALPAPPGRVFAEGPRYTTGLRGEAEEILPGGTHALRYPKGFEAADEAAARTQALRELGRDPTLTGKALKNAVDARAAEILSEGYKPGQIVVGARVAKEGADVVPTKDYIEAGGKPEGMSLRDWVKLQNSDEAAKAATVLDDLGDDAAAAPGHITASVAAARPRSEIGWSEALKTIFGPFRNAMSPSFLMKQKYPAGAEIAKKLVLAEREMEKLAYDWGNKLKAIHKDVGKDVFEAAVQKRDLGLGASTAEEKAVLDRLAEVFDDMASKLSLDPDHPNFITNYVPRLRQNVKIEKSRLIQTDDYISEDLIRSLPSDLKLYFTKKRTPGSGPSERYDLDYLMAHAKASARGAVYGTPQHNGVLNDIRPLLAQMDDAPIEVQEYLANYVNFMIGARGSRSKESAMKLGNIVRSYQFVRNLGFNPMSVVYNSLQRGVTAAEVSVKNFVAGQADEIAYYAGNKRLDDLIKKARRVDLEASPLELSNLRSADISQDVAREGAIARGIGVVRDVTGVPFGAMERSNRLHAFFAGFRDAVDRGLSESDALKYASDIVDKTQFITGKADKPALYRKELGATLGQFKSYPTKMLEYMGSNFMDMFRKGVSTQDRRAAVNKFVKFWGAQYALGGPQSLPFVGDWLDKHDPAGWKGLGPMMGVAIKDQLASGLITPRGVKQLMYFLPGPTVRQIYDVARITGIEPAFMGTRPPDPAETAKRLVTSTLGVQAERARRGMLINEKGEEREPETFGQAFGLEPIPSTAPLIARDVSPIGKAIGILTPEREREYEQMEEEREIQDIRNTAVAAAQQAKDRGDIRAHNRIIAEAEDAIASITGKRGKITLSKQSARAAKERANMTALERLRKHGGKQLESFREEEEE